MHTRNHTPKFTEEKTVLILPDPLSARETEACLAAAAEGDEKARTRLALANVRLVIHLSGRYCREGVDREDLIGDGIVSLLQGLDSYDRAKEVKLGTYITRCVTNAFSSHLKKHRYHCREVSLDAPVCLTDAGREVTLYDLIPGSADHPDYGMENAERKGLLDQASFCLDSREKEILELRYGWNRIEEAGLTQEETGFRMGISQPYTSQLERDALNKMKEEIALQYTS